MIKNIYNTYKNFLCTLFYALKSRFGARFEKLFKKSDNDDSEAYTQIINEVWLGLRRERFRS